MTLSGWAGKRVPRDILHLKSPNQIRETAGDITRTGREAREGGAPDGGSFLGSSTRWLLFRYHNREEGPAGPSARLEGGDGALGWKPQSGLDVTTLSLENLLTDVMRQRGDTCAPVRAALVQLRVANGVKKLRRWSVRNAALASPALWRLSRGGGWGALAGIARGLPSGPWHSWKELVPGGPKCPTAWRVGPHQAAQKQKINPDGPGSWWAGVQSQRGPGAPFVLRSLTSGKGQGTVNQRGRERTGAGRGITVESCSGGGGHGGTPEPRRRGASGRREEGRLLPEQLKTKELKGLPNCSSSSSSSKLAGFSPSARSAAWSTRRDRRQPRGPELGRRRRNGGGGGRRYKHFSGAGGGVAEGRERGRMARCRARTGAGQPRPCRRERALRGGAQAGNRAPLGRSPQEDTAAPFRRATACIRPRTPCGRRSPWSNTPARFWQARPPLGPPALSFPTPLRPAVTAAVSRSVPQRSARGRSLLRNDEIIAGLWTTLPTRGLNTRPPGGSGPGLCCPQANSVKPPLPLLPPIPMPPPPRCAGAPQAGTEIAGGCLCTGDGSAPLGRQPWASAGLQTPPELLLNCSAVTGLLEGEKWRGRQGKEACQGPRMRTARQEPRGALELGWRNGSSAGEDERPVGSRLFAAVQIGGYEGRRKRKGWDLARRH
ncbi:hypothetical protein Cadr_000001501 [Camelus dromedarius]|uniref:Uncharacterized protein n=1 Tax=Camelus dromedarius TaxID=9838 RepID=A0A5N4EFR6_CAMDR|nr:hypothetical protein Cadr_000001501 [Camelus dromedarius]